MKPIYQLLKDISTWATYLSIIIGFTLLFVKSNTRTQAMIKVYFFIMALLEYAGYYYTVIRKKNNEFLYSIYGFLEITLVATALYFFLNNELLKKKLAKIVVAVSICCIVILTLNEFFLQEIGLTTTVMSVPILCFSFIVFYSLLEVDLDSKLPIVFVIYLFLMHGVAVIIHVFYKPIMSLPKEQIIDIYFIRAIVFLLAKSIVLIYLANVLVFKKDILYISKKKKHSFHVQ